MMHETFNPAYSQGTSRRHVFSPLGLPRRAWREERQLHAVYRVFPAQGEAVVVDAETATDAIAKSGVEAPRKVVKGRFSLEDVLAPDMLKESGETFFTRVDAPEETPLPSL